MSKPTPGPWRTVKLAIDATTDEEKIIGPHGEFVAQVLVPHAGETRQEEHEANTRLIKAAPDLLAALRQCYSDLQRYAPNSAGSVSARLALLKAQGG